MNKKGVSAVIATVLIIMITVAAVAIIWSFVIPMIKDSLEDSVSGKVSLNIETKGGYTVYDSINQFASVQIERGQDDFELRGIQVIFTFSDGTSRDFEVNESNYGTLAKGTSSVYIFKMLNDSVKVSIAPIIISGGNSKIMDLVDEQNVIKPASIPTPLRYIDWDGNFVEGVYVDPCDGVLSECPSASTITCGTTVTVSENGCGTCNVKGTLCDFIDDMCVSGDCVPLVVGGKNMIYTCQMLQDIQNDLTADYVLGGDIDCGFFGNFEPISVFRGTLDGKEYVISSLDPYKTNGNNIGLFGEANGASIYKIGLKSISIDAGGSNHIGAFVGSASNVVLEEVYATGDIEGFGYSVGGLVGSGSGTIINSYSIVSIDTDPSPGSIVGGLVGDASGFSIMDSYSAGSIEGEMDIGGLIGYGQGNNLIDNSFFAGYLDSYNKPAGGLIGENEGQEIEGISNSYWWVGPPWFRVDYCEGYNELGATSECINISSINYFYNSANEPLSRWNSSVWTFSEIKFPTLKWQ